MSQKIITNMYHVVSNPHRFDVIIFDKIVRLYDVYIYRTIKVTQLFLWVPYTRATLLVYVPNVALTNDCCVQKKFFCVATIMSHNFDMSKKFFCWHNFFQKIFHNIFFCSWNIYFHFPPGGNISVYFPLQNIYVISNIFWNKLYPAK